MWARLLDPDARSDRVDRLTAQRVRALGLGSYAEFSA
jgi:hypothetical protein